MTVSIRLSDEQATVLKAKAEALGVSLEQYARQVLEHDLGHDDLPTKHISEVIQENMRDVPAEILAAMPSDGASQHDHYIYGLPKKTV